MEGFIPVLIALAYFVLQAYTGDQKEKEKAAKRQLGKAVAPKPESTRRPAGKGTEQRKRLHAPVERPVSNREPVHTDYAEQPTVYNPSAEYDGRQNHQKEYKQKRYVPDMPPSLLDEYRKLSEYAEIEKVKAEKRKAMKSQNYGSTIRPKLEQLETEDIDGLNAQEYEIDFDVREAVLAKAILDRPYS